MFLRHIRCPLLRTHTNRANASTLSTASGTIQPCFATGTAQSVTSHRTTFSSAFGATSCHIARAAVYPLLLSNQDC